MTTVIHYFGPTNDENISERALRAIENSDVEIKLYDYNKFDVLVRFEDDEQETYTFEVRNSELVHQCKDCGGETSVYYADKVNRKTIIALIEEILDHSRYCLATVNLSFIKRDFLSSLKFIESNDAYAIATSIYYLAEIIRRMR